MTKIIMVRHGQSMANKESRFAGHSDFDLSDLGREQARLAAEYLADRERPDAIYSSDLLRAHNTAVPFAQIYNLPINDTEGLREIFAGSWEGLEMSEIAERYTEDLRVWREDFSNARCTDGESVAELYARIVKFVCELARAHDGECLLLATHATPIRAIECYSRGYSAERMADVHFVKNAALNIFEYNPDDDSIIGIETNIVEHLSDTMVTDVPKSLKN